MTKAGKELKVNEIFLSRQGAGLRTGVLTTFVRLTGCNLTCRWCDTMDAKSNGKLVPVPAVANKVGEFPASEVCITGGEPLLQKEGVVELCALLLKQKQDILLETNGTISWEGIPFGTKVSMDLKPPSSEMEKFNDYGLVGKLTFDDQLTMVVQDRRDYDWVESVLTLHRPQEHTNIILQPVGGVYARNLWRWAEREPRVRVMLQMGKVVWGNAGRLL